MTRRMKPIPISEAQEIAAQYGYDQIVIIGRRVGELPDPCGEHVTTYGRTKAHCDVAARIGNFLKYKIMGWQEEHVLTAAVDAAMVEMENIYPPLKRSECERLIRAAWFAKGGAS